MARLTKKDGKCSIAPAACNVVPYWKCNFYSECSECERFAEVTTRLAEYETATHAEDSTEILTVEEISGLAKAKQEGRLVPPLPCAIGASVFTIQESFYDCRHCQYGDEQAIDDPTECTKGRVNGMDRRCPIVIDEHQCTGYDVSARSEIDKGPCLSLAGKHGCEGLEHFCGIDGKQYFSREEAEKALEGMKCQENV